MDSRTMRQFGRPKDDVARLPLDLCRFAFIKARVEEIEIASTRVPGQPCIQLTVNVGQALVTASIAANIG